MLILLILVVAIAALLFVGTRLPTRRLTPLLALPDHRWAPVVVGALTGADRVAEFTAFREQQIAFFVENTKTANIRIE